MDTKQRKLELVRKAILDEHVTPQLAAQAKTLVFGEGDVNAAIVFIGEAPGKNEDEQGRPFVGASGRFLDELLATIGTTRDQVYITSILKYRPPKNRDPFPAEKQAFLPYLQAQLEVIRPKVIVTLGRHSLNCFLPDLQISNVHGQPQQLRLADTTLSNGSQAQALAVWVMPLFHPAAALYNPKLRQTLLDDFAKIPPLLVQGSPQ